MVLKASIVVLNYNGKHLLKECLTSLKNQVSKDFKTYVLDNASTDNSKVYLKKNFHWVNIIKNNHNDGTAKGSNVAAKNTKSKYIVFMSNDIALDKNCIKILIQELDNNPDVGICTTKLLRPEKSKKTGKHLIDNLGGDLDIYGFAWPRYALKSTGKCEKRQEVFLTYGGCFIIRRQIFEKIGGFDNKFFTLNDDIDLSWRVRLLGFKIIVNPAAFAHHKMSATLKNLFNRPKKRYWSERNCLRTLLKNYSFASLLRILPIYFFIEILEIGFFLVIKKQPAMSMAVIKAFLWNLVNLSNTLDKRFFIQNKRKVSDKEIQRLMINKSFKLTKFKNFI